VPKEKNHTTIKKEYKFKFKKGEKI